MKNRTKIIVILAIVIYCVSYVSIYIYKRGDLQTEVINTTTNNIDKFNELVYEIGTTYASENAKQIPVLTFHRIVDHETKTKLYSTNEWYNDLDVTTEELKWLYENGWKTVDLDTFYKWMKNEIELPSKTFVITIDDGDAEAYYNVLPLLEKYNFNATLFVIGGEVPLFTRELNEPEHYKLGYDKIKELRENKSLLQVESHSYNLHYRDNKTGKEAALIKTYEELEEDFEKNDFYNFKYMAYPYGAYNDKMLEAIKNSNIKMAFTFQKKDYARQTDNIYEVHRLKINGEMTLEDFKKLFLYIK